VRSNNQDCVKSLVYKGLNDREAVMKRHTDGTCEWLLKSPQYLGWLENHGLLLIRGKPGCGKSTLLKLTLGKHVEDASSTNCIVLSFFFYASGTELQKGRAGLFRSLLLQLFEQDVYSKHFFQGICRKLRATEEGKDSALEWKESHLENIFWEMITNCSKRRDTTIFIDAIDECRTQDRDSLIGFFHNLKGIKKERLNRPRVFFTGRIYPDGQIETDFRIRLEEENQSDILNFITKELRLPAAAEIATVEMKELLQKKANGLFLWLRFMIRQVHTMIEQGLSLKSIESEVSRCPQELDGYIKISWTKYQAKMSSSRLDAYSSGSYLLAGHCHWMN
jgi:energy-coupling factor transporter ATP-binding protein EcfA2